MLRIPTVIAAVAFFVSFVFAGNIPVNVEVFYWSVILRGQCLNKLATGFYSTDVGGNSYSYCGDYLPYYNVIYLTGLLGSLANMDIDCDGTQGGPADDGRCGSSEDTQSITSFQDIVEGYDRGIKDLNANIHPYVVFGNAGKKPGWKTFSPRKHGIEPLSVIAVVCNNQLVYGIWGDENGDDGDNPMIGEASISLATACFGEDMNGNNGYDDEDVLYIAFPGKEAVPGADGANWSAANYNEFEDSIRGLGDKLIERIPWREGSRNPGWAPYIQGMPFRNGTNF